MFHDYEIINTLKTDFQESGIKAFKFIYQFFYITSIQGEVRVIGSTERQFLWLHVGNEMASDVPLGNKIA